MLLQVVYALENSQRPLNNIDNTGPAKEYPRENEMSTNRSIECYKSFSHLFLNHAVFPSYWLPQFGMPSVQAAPPLGWSFYH